METKTYDLHNEDASDVKMNEDTKEAKDDSCDTQDEEIINSDMTPSTAIKLLDKIYMKAIDGIPGTNSAIEIAEGYLKKSKSKEIAVDDLIKWQIAKCATSGFITGLGGIITLPVAIPANIASVLYVQMRMIAAIAYIGGYDVRDDQVKTYVYVCLTGNEAKDILKNVGINLATKLSKTAINKISGSTLTRINQAVGFRLITKFGTKGVVNLGKMLPLVGGVIGGSFDAAATSVIGSNAKRLFIS